jgi:hypothetical protein
LDPTEREELAEAVIDFIIARTQAGIGVKPRGRGFQNFDFPAYTEEYSKKKKKTRVNLVDTFDMLNNIDLISHKKGSLLIGFERGSDLNGKAEGNALGSYGRSPNKKKARPFLGITKNDLDAVLDEVF